MSAAHNKERERRIAELRARRVEHPETLAGLPLAEYEQALKNHPPLTVVGSAEAQERLAAAQRKFTEVVEMAREPEWKIRRKQRRQAQIQEALDQGRLDG